MRSSSVVCVLLVIAFVANVRGQELTVTATAANTVSSKTSIDLPGLTGNPLAIIVATPVGDTALLNPHPLGAWYYSGKWNLFNSNHQVMPLGAKYKVRFFLRPGPSQFLHVVTKENIGAEGTYIDNPALNGNPAAKVQILQNHAPEARTPPNLNPNEAKAEYSTAASRWFIANVNGQPIGRGAAYNIVVETAAAGPVANPAPPSGPPATVPPTGGVIVGNVPPYTPQLEPTPGPVPITGQPPPRTPVTTPPPSTVPADPNRGKDWILQPEPLPAILPNSEILLFIHGMDSRAEESDDITRALFALKANAPGSQAPPTSTPAGSPNPQIVAALQRTLQKYESCILEKYETQQDLQARGVNKNESGLLNTNGLQVRDNIACVAGNTCSRAARQSGFNSLKAQANRGDPVNFETSLKQIIPKDCFDCSSHAIRHTKHVHCTMHAGGNNGLIQGPIFEHCKAGVDLVALATAVINEIHAALAVIGTAPPQAIGGSTIATNFSTVQFNSCSNPGEGCPETCDNPDDFSQGSRKGVLPAQYFAPKVPLVLLDSTNPAGSIFNVPAARNIGANEGRLRSDLRAAAADMRPLESLRLAAYQFASGDQVLGKAFADLAVTGRRAFEDFQTADPNEPFCQSLIAGRPAPLTEPAVLEGCHSALDRAYRVANFLRTGQRAETDSEKTRKATERTALGWIAVSGEDDQPHRPVNVPSSDFPQYDLDVMVEAPGAAGAKTVKVRTRYVIAQSKIAYPASGGKNLVMISLDLPTSGYADNLDFDAVSPLTDLGQVVTLPIPDFRASGKTPVLDFIETFVVRFTETLDQKTPMKANFKAVMGGSLGGNMTFRLGRRPGFGFPKYIVWSPASIWQSLGAGSDPLKHFGPRSAYEGADRANIDPRIGDRAAFFASWDKAILPLVIPMAQSDTWTSDFYPCKKSAVASARLDRQETYDANFLSWHWRLGGEQLLFSHQTINPATNQPLYMSNQKPMLLACGTEDTVAFNDICPATKNTAPLMTMTPGKALFLEKTGHSLDNERRKFFA
ncbi:MAG: hypothetical protein ABL984_16630, partial [Pyrinomonadaceae bacterium]